MNKNNCRQSRVRPGHLLRQTLAVALAFSLFAGLATPAFADNAVAPTAHKPSNAENEMPKITLQINGVIDEQTKKFTEYVEVAVLVESGVKYYDSTHAEISKDTFDANAALAAPVAGYTAEVQAFRYLSLALEYNAEILTPVAWGDPTTGVNAPTPVLSDPYTASFKNQVIFPTLKGKANTTAIAHVSGPTDAVVAANASHNSTGLFYLMAEADKPVELTTPTALAVVRFQYTPSTDAASYLTDPAHMLLTDSTPWAALNKASEVTSGAYRETDVTAWQNAPDENWLVRFAPDAVVGTPSTAAPDAVQLMYRSDGNIFYYSTEVVNGTLNSSAHCLPIYADNDTDESDPASQLLIFGNDKNVRMVYTNRPTFDSSGGLDYSKLTACVIVDADNTILGTVIVPKNADVRQLINDYVRDNFVYEYTDGTTDSLRTLTSAQVASLERVDTYRGKYPATAPAVDGTVEAATMVKDAKGNWLGESYPLTNKLDYVFFKRPMERVATGKPNVSNTTAYPQGENDPNYKADYANWLATAGWTQKAGATATTPLYDTEYPFAYGWALCTQDNYQDTWTWLGSNGELSNYAKDANGFATVTYQNGAEGVTFAFADLENGFTTGQDTVFLKAVYEPGTELMRGKYRMIKKPYLSKLNASAAEAGGSYGAEFTLERSTTDGADGYVRGATIIREPVVKQAVTFDNLWEENSDLGVNHNLPSATLSETENFEKSAYIQVEVLNVEQIIVNLTFSARMNKIEYELMDKYGKNFIGADSRGYDNLSYMTANDDKGNWIADNYNYYVDGESYDTDMWYDAPYKYREGSYGFVLFGTLNSVMQYATIHNADPSESDFNRNVTANVLNNINISMDGNPVDLGTLSKIRERILSAAADAETAYNNGSGDAQWWDVEHDCAQLTYHQLQNYILTCDSSNKNGTLLPGATEANKINALTWCHLHAACASNLGDVPANWEDMIKTARGADGKDPSALGSMKTAEIETLAHLRADQSGTALTPAQFQTKLVQAVTDLDAIAGNTTTIWSWDLIQDRIIRGAGYDSTGAYSQEHYWWYDGAAAMNFATLAETVNAAIDALEAPLMPDGSQTATRTAKINQLEPIFDANASAADVTTGWRNATKNLAITKNSVEGEKFDTFHDTVNDADNFLEHLYDALKDAKTANGGTIPTLAATASASDIREYWNKLQYHILHGSYPLSPTTAQQNEMDGYWWYDGATKIVDLPSLLSAADAANNGNTAVLDLFTIADLTTYKEKLNFRKGFNGTTDVYDPADPNDLTAFTTAVKNFVNQYGVTVTKTSSAAAIADAWRQLQYYLIHPGADFSQPAVSSDYSTEYPYYWWREGVAGANYNALNPGKADANIKTLLEAAYRHAVNGNPQAYSRLDTLGITAMDTFRLIPDYDQTNDASHHWDDLTHYGTGAYDMTALKGQLDALALAIEAAGDDRNAVSWRQVQHYLLGKGYVTNAQLAANDNLIPSDSASDTAGYWWRNDDNNPNAGSGQNALQKMVKAMNDYLTVFSTGTNAEKTTALNTLKSKVDDIAPDLSLKTGTYNANTGALTISANAYESWTTAQKNNLKNRIAYTVQNLVNKRGLTEVDTVVDWYYLQYICFNNVLAGANTGTATAPQPYSVTLPFYVNTLLGNSLAADWSPSFVDVATDAAAASLTLSAVSTPTPLMSSAPLSLSAPQTATSEDGLTTTVTDSDYIVDEETGSWTLTQTVTSTTRTDSFEVVTTTITTTTFDPETGLTDTVTEVTNSVLTYETKAEESSAPSDGVVTPVDPAPVDIGDYTIEPDAVIVIGTDDPVEEPAEPTVEELAEEPTEEPAEEPTEEPTEETTPEPDADPPDDTGPTETPAPTEADTTQSTEEEGETMTIAPETSATARLSYWSPPDPGGTYMVVYGPPAFTTNRWEVIS